MTENFFLGVGGFIALIGLLAVRVPVAYTMIIIGTAGVMIISGPNILMNQLKDLAYAQFSIYDLSVVPMFVLMGGIASRCGLSKDLFTAANAFLGRMRGGVAMAAIAACAGFGALCGSSTATASTMGQVALPELKKLKYSGALATGTLAAGGTLGILIPPSVVLIVYAVIVEANIVKMFAAALVPGLLAMVMFMITIWIYTFFVPDAAPRNESPAAGDRLKALVAVLPVFVIFGVVIGGIYAGVYSPTAAAAVGVVMVVIYGVSRGRLQFRGFVDALGETARTTGMIFLILFGAELLKVFLARIGAPQAAAEMLQGSGMSPYAILILTVLIFLVLGCLMDSLSMVILAVPFFWPVIAGLDFGMTPDETKIWFGIIILIVVELGLITPPVGLNVFIINALSPEIPMRETFKGVMPFFLSEIVRIALLISLPVLVLALPRMLQ